MYKPETATLNSRDEIFNPCRHKWKFMLSNSWGSKPSWNFFNHLTLCSFRHSVHYGTSVIYLFECFVFEVICLQFKLIFFDFNVMNVDISYTYYQHWRDIYQKSMIVGEKNERKRNFLQQMWHNFWQINIKDYKIHNSGENIGHACLRMVNIGRPLLDPNFKNISSVGGEYLRLIVMYWEASQNLRGAVNLAL